MPLRVKDHGDDDKAAVLSAELAGFTPRQVRAYLTTPKLLTTWWAEEAETDPRPGGGFVLRWTTPGYTLRGTYARVDDEVVAFTWKFAHEKFPERRVVWALDGDEDGTTVTIRHEFGRPAERQEYVEGWQHFLNTLSMRPPAG